MQASKLMALFLTSSLLMAGCGETSNPPVGSEADTASSAAVSSSMLESGESNQESNEESNEESGGVVVEEDAPSESATSESATPAAGGTTQLNEQEAGVIERGKNRIAELTGYPEGEQYLYFIGEVQGSVVTIEIRENGEQAASAVGFYRYDDATGAAQQMDITTGEYVDLPANP